MNTRRGEQTEEKDACLSYQPDIRSYNQKLRSLLQWDTTCTGDSSVVVQYESQMMYWDLVFLDNLETMITACVKVTGLASLPSHVA